MRSLLTLFTLTLGLLVAASSSVRAAAILTNVPISQLPELPVAVDPDAILPIVQLDPDDAEVLVTYHIKVRDLLFSVSNPNMGISNLFATNITVFANIFVMGTNFSNYIVSTNGTFLLLSVSNLVASNFLGTEFFIPMYNTNGIGITNSPAYVDVANTNHIVIGGTGGSEFNNSVRYPFLHAGGIVIDSQGFLVNGTSDGTNTAVQQIGPGTVPYLPRWVGTNLLSDSGMYAVASTNVGFDGVLLWGPGATNALYRSGGNLVYTNGTSNPGFQVISGIGESSYFLAGSSAALVRGINGVTLSDESGNTVRLFAKYFAPSVTDEKLGGDYGTSLHPWAQVNSLGETIWGYKGAASTNYSRLAVSHGGTNGYVEFRSQGLGIAGVGRPFSFTNDTANAALSAWSTNGNALTMLTDAGNVPTLLSSTATLYLKQTGGAAFLYLNNGAFGPNNDNVIDNGTRSASWNDGAYKGTVYIAGMDNGSTDYSRLAISHTGTNNSIVFDSQSSGIAGDARGFSIRTNNVEVANINFVAGFPQFVIGKSGQTVNITGNNIGGTIASAGNTLVIGAGAKSVTMDTGSSSITPSTDGGFALGSSGARYSRAYLQNGVNFTASLKWLTGAGTPEGAVAADVGSLYTRTDGGAGTTLYVKESGTGNTGWVAK